MSLSTISHNKLSTSKSSLYPLDYKVITRVVITFEAGLYSPSKVSELIQLQVGFQVILLDSKCFPLVESDTKTAIEFWKSNQRVLAALQIPSYAVKCMQTFDLIVLEGIMWSACMRRWILPMLEAIQLKTTKK